MIGESPLHKCSINGKKNLGFPLVLSMGTFINLLGAIHPSSTMQNECKNPESVALIFQFGIFFSTSWYLPWSRDIYLKYCASFNKSIQESAMKSMACILCCSVQPQRLYMREHNESLDWLAFSLSPYLNSRCCNRRLVYIATAIFIMSSSYLQASDCLRK